MLVPKAMISCDPPKLMELSCSTFSRLEVCNVDALQDNSFTQYIHLLKGLL